MRRPTRFRNIFGWALGLGLLGLIGGTMLQMVYVSSQSKDLPLMGVLISGPLGVVIGGIFGWFKPLRSRYED